MEKRQQFILSSESIAFDKEHRKIINYNISKYIGAAQQGKSQFVNINLAKQRASATKNKVIENLDKFLIEFESNFIKKGGKIIWAQNAEDAIAEIKKIAKSSSCNHIVKSKSMVTEEINLNKELVADSVEVIETDLGEYIQQLSGEPPYHILTPAMHKSKESIAELPNAKKQTDSNVSPNELAEFVRNELRDKFITAQIGVTGANYLIADTGSVVLTENEGNAINGMAFPKVHISICGIEKLIPSIYDLDVFITLLASFGTGQQITTYNSIISGPKQNDEDDGPDEMYLILLDNNRTGLLALAEQRRALACIKCGACSNVCPVYKNVGGHTYGAVYGGPIGSVIMPHLKPEENYYHLSSASTMCGKCTASCPVGIDIHKLLLYNRRDFVAKGHSTKTENLYRFFWKTAMLKRSKMDKGGAKVKNFMMRQFFRKQWGERREMPEVVTKSFNQQWREQRGIK